jgi:riboflavin synthase
MQLIAPQATFQGGPTVFTGIVEIVAPLRSASGSEAGLYLTFECPANFVQGVKLGDSVAVNGCCLTTVEAAGTTLSFEAVRETIERSNLSALRPGSKTNLERALRVGDRLGGHFVQGHVDGVAHFVSSERIGLERRMKLKLSASCAADCITKGSIAVNGVSLTIAALKENAVEIAVIPHTWDNTTLALLSPGDPVNIETDMIGKWVKRHLTAMTAQPDRPPIDEDFLRKHGFA